MRKNTASQVIGSQMVSATDGSAFTGTVTVYVTIDGGTQGIGTVGSGVCTHEGNGLHTYAPSQAETNGNHLAFTFTGSGTVPSTVQVYTISFDPHDTVRLGITALPNAAADGAGGLVISDAGGLDADAQAASVAATEADTNELQTDWANGGRLDLILDATALEATAQSILADTGTDGVVVASGSKTGYSLSSSGLDSVVVETSLNARQALSIIASACTGVLAGAATTTVTIAAAGVPATNRITATVDASGNRSGVTLSLPS